MKKILTCQKWKNNMETKEQFEFMQAIHDLDLKLRECQRTSDEAVKKIQSVIPKLARLIEDNDQKDANRTS